LLFDFASELHGVLAPHSGDEVGSVLARRVFAERVRFEVTGLAAGGDRDLERGQALDGLTGLRVNHAEKNAVAFAEQHGFVHPANFEGVFPHVYFFVGRSGERGEQSTKQNQRAESAQGRA